MLYPDHLMYVASKIAMERYCQQEGIPTRHVPDLVSNDDDVLEGTRYLLQALRRVLTVRRSVVRHQANSDGQYAAMR